MHAVRRSQIVVGEELSDAFVGEQHRLFNQAGGGTTFARDDVDGNALVIQEHVNLGRLEIDRAALTTNLTPSAGKRVCVSEEGGEVDARDASSVEGGVGTANGRSVRRARFRRPWAIKRVAGPTARSSMNGRGHRVVYSRRRSGNISSK